MKMKNMAIMASAVLATGFAAQANEISGSVNMAGSATLDTDSLATATMVATFAGGPTLVTSGTQNFAGTAFPASTLVTWQSPLTFAAGPEAVTPLWTYTVIGSGTVFSFNLSSIASYVVNGTDTGALLTGYGTLNETGWTPTPGNFTLTLTDSSAGHSAQATFGFAASDTTQAVPDGGLTVALLGGAMAGMTLIRRRIAS